jgi:hypothetical protein
MAETSLVNRVAIHATAESALPTRPSAGTNITQAAWSTAGFDTIGSSNLRSDEYDIDEDSFNWAVEERKHRTSAPISDGIDETILLGRKLEPFEIKMFSIDAALLTFGSDIAVASSVVTWANTMTYRAVAWEIYGQGVFSFPKCDVSFTNIEMGMVEDQVARATMIVVPHNTSTHPGGWHYEEY